MNRYSLGSSVCTPRMIQLNWRNIDLSIKYILSMRNTPNNLLYDRYIVDMHLSLYHRLNWASKVCNLLSFDNQNNSGCNFQPQVNQFHRKSPWGCNVKLQWGFLMSDKLHNYWYYQCMLGRQSYCKDYK